MSSTYLKVTIEKTDILKTPKFKTFVSCSVLEETLLTQILLNFKTSCCNLKIRTLEAKLSVAFLLL